MFKNAICIGETLVNIIVNYFMTGSTQNSQQWTENKANVSARASFLKKYPSCFGSTYTECIRKLLAGKNRQ